MTGNKSKFTAKKMKPRKAGAAELAEEDLDRITGGAHDTFLEVESVPGESTDEPLGRRLASSRFKKP